MERLVNLLCYNYNNTMPPNTPNNSNNNQKPSQNQSGPKQSPQNNQNGNPELSRLRSEFSRLKNKKVSMLGLPKLDFDKNKKKDLDAAALDYEDSLNKYKVELEQILSESNLIQSSGGKKDSNKTLANEIEKYIADTVDGELLYIEKEKEKLSPENMAIAHKEEMVKISSSVRSVKEALRKLLKEIEEAKKKNLNGELTDSQKSLYLDLQKDLNLEYRKVKLVFEGKKEEARYAEFNVLNKQAEATCNEIESSLDNINSGIESIETQVLDEPYLKSPEEDNKIMREGEQEMQHTHAKLNTLLIEIQKRKETGKKISDAEKIEFLSRGESLMSKCEYDYERLITQVNPASNEVNRLVSNILGVPNFSTDPASVDESNTIFTKIKEALDKSVDESPEKYKKTEGELDKNILEIAKINAEIVKEIESKGKVSEESKTRLRFELSQINNNLIQTAGDISKVRESLGATPTDEQINRDNKIFVRQGYAMSVMVDAESKLDDKKEMSAKEQRENAKGISDRIRIIDKQISEDIDKLSIGKKLSADQKEGHKVSLDVEIVNLKEAQDELDALEDIKENQPTRNLVESILIRAENRIQELTDKLEKVRIATEKEVMEKLDAAEKEIEKIEANIVEINRKDAEGRNTLKLAKQEHKEANSNDQNLGIFRKSMKSLFAPNPSYSNGQTYHTQKSVSENLFDPKTYVKEAKDWLADMPESNDKEKKIKTKLMKKARRMNRRITSTKWRHYMTLSAYEKGAYLGDKVGMAIVDKIDDGLDRIFG